MLDRRIELFLTVAETGSMSAASKQLYMAQPTLSQQMSALEKDLDVTLLERGSRGVSLTPAGQVLYEDAKRISEQAAGTLERMRDLDRHTGAVLRIGGSMNQRELFMPEVISAFSQTYPDTELAFITMPAQDIPRAVAEGRIDVATHWLSASVRELKLQWDVVATFDVGICMSSSHRPAEQDSVALADLDGETLVVNSYGHYDASDAIRNEVASSPYSITLVDASDDEPMESYTLGRALSIIPIPYPFERPHIHIARLDTELKIPVGLITAQNRSLAAKRFVSMAKSTLKEA